MLKKLLGLFIALFIIAGQIEAYALFVDPIRLEVNTNKSKKNYVPAVLNIGGDLVPSRYKITTGYFTVNSNGDADIIESKVEDKYDARDKVRFLPSEFNVKPGQTQKVRLNIVDIDKLPEGESRAMVFVENLDTNEYKQRYNSKITLGIVLKTRIGIPVYIYKGKFIKHAKIDYFKVVEDETGKYTELKVNSTGNSLIKYNAKVQILDGRKLISEYPISTKAVAGNSSVISKDKIVTDKFTEAGEYTLRVVLSYPNEKNKKKILKEETQLRLNTIETESL